MIDKHHFFYSAGLVVAEVQILMLVVKVAGEIGRLFSRYMANLDEENGQGQTY